MEFDNLRIAYNYLYKESHKTEKDMWDHLYKKHKTIEKLERMFGISKVEISKRLKHLGIILLSEDDKKTPKERLLFSIPLDIIKTTSQKELAEIVGCTQAYICQMLKARNVEYVKSLGGRPKQKK